MAQELITKIRAELLRIKKLRKTSTERITAESLKTFPGFGQMSLEMRQQFMETMRELCRIALQYINNGNKRKNG